jgi:hypothetical protein
MNASEKTQPHLVQKTDEQALQIAPAKLQESFPVLEEEQLEEVTGGMERGSGSYLGRTIFLKLGSGSSTGGLTIVGGKRTRPDSGFDPSPRPTKVQIVE